MKEILFMYNGIEITIECEEDQKMKDIFIKLSEKIGINHKNLEFKYQGNIINENLIFNEFLNKINLEKIIKIVVNNKNIIISKISEKKLYNNEPHTNDIDIKD